MAKRGQGEGTISKRPDGTWWARVTIGRDESGKQKRKAFYGKTRKEVQEKLTAALNEVNTGTYIEPTKMTVAQWLDFWLYEYKKRSIKPKTFAAHYSAINSRINPYIGDIKLKDLRNDHIQKYINQLSDKEYAPSVIKGTYRVLNCALNKAMDNSSLASNPCKGVVCPANNRMRPRVLSGAEQEQFEQLARQSYYGKGLIIMLYTGLRIGELMALTWKHIDFENSILRVEQTALEYMDYDGDLPKISRGIGTPKTKASIRMIPLVPIVVEILKELQAEYPLSDEYIFCRVDGKPIRYLRFWEYLNTTAEKMGIEGLHPHCLRHTFATRCLEKGINIKVVQEILGHTSIKMTADMYTQTTDDMKKDSIMKLVNS